MPDVPPNKDATLSAMKTGDFMVKEGLITEQQLKEALDFQENQKKYEPLGQVCVDKKFITRFALNNFLKKYKKSISLGILLLNFGLITKSSLIKPSKFKRFQVKSLGPYLWTKVLLRMLP